MTHRTLTLAATILAAAIPVAALAAWTGAPANPPSSNANGPLWLQTGTPTLQTGNTGMNGDVYMQPTKALRVDNTTSSILNIGNWGGGNGFFLKIFGGVEMSPAANSTTAPILTMNGQSRLNVYQICLTADTCRTAWPSSGGGGGSGIPQFTQVLNAGRVATTTPDFAMGFTATTGTFSLNSNTNVTTFLQLSNINAGSVAAAGLRLTTNGGDSYVYRTSNAYVSGVPDDTVIQDAGGGDLVFYGTLDNFRIKNSGNVLVGTNAAPITGIAVEATGTTFGVHGISTGAGTGFGVVGDNATAGGTGVMGRTTGANGTGVYAVTTGANGYAMFANGQGAGSGGLYAAGVDRGAWIRNGNVIANAAIIGGGSFGIAATGTTYGGKFYNTEVSGGGAALYASGTTYGLQVTGKSQAALLTYSGNGRPQFDWVTIGSNLFGVNAQCTGTICTGVQGTGALIGGSFRGSDIWSASRGVEGWNAAIGGMFQGRQEGVLSYAYEYPNAVAIMGISTGTAAGEFRYTKDINTAYTNYVRLATNGEGVHAVGASSGVWGNGEYGITGVGNSYGGFFVSNNTGMYAQAANGQPDVLTGGVYSQFSSQNLTQTFLGNAACGGNYSGMMFGTDWGSVNCGSSHVISDGSMIEVAAKTGSPVSIWGDSVNMIPVGGSSNRMMTAKMVSNIPVLAVGLSTIAATIDPGGFYLWPGLSGANYTTWGTGNWVGMLNDSTNVNTGLRFMANGAYTPIKASAFTPSSDARLKNIDGSYNGGLDVVMGLKPTKFHWKKGDTDTQHVGFIAQDMLPVIPEAVRAPSDDKDFYSIDPVAITAATVNAIQDLKKENDELKAKLSDLEERLQKLEAK